MIHHVISQAFTDVSRDCKLFMNRLFQKVKVTGYFKIQVNFYKSAELY
jgi:hypothetical protein